MNKLASVSFILAAFSAPVFAQGSLESVLARTDLQMAQAVAGAEFRSEALPALTPVADETRVMRLTDITDACTRDGDVVSAFPAIYKQVPVEENARIIKVFSFADTKGVERRVEVFYTGGDWMQYGLVYIISNAGVGKDKARAFFIADLSTSDREEGSVAPKVDPFDNAGLAAYISGRFLDAAGGVKASFGSLAETQAN